ncbi:MAG TPA: hypothetical protein VFY89_10545 [Ktedonobacterales bacterium]
MAWIQRVALHLSALPMPRLVPRLVPRLARGWLGKLAMVVAPARFPANWLPLLGLVAVGVLLVAFVLARFGRGGWIVVPLIVGLGLVPLVAARWRGMARRSARSRKEAAARILLPARAPRHIVIVPIGSLNQPALQCLLYACSVIPEVRAVYVATDEAREAAVRADWQDWIATCHPPGALAAVKAPTSASERGAGGPPRRVALLPPDPRLVVIESPTRTLLPPLLAYISATSTSNLDAMVMIMLPEWMPEHWWQRPLANRTARRLRLALYQLPRVVVATVPYHSPK